MSNPASVQRMARRVTDRHRPLPWVCRTDIKGYYANIDKTRLLSQLRAIITDPALWSLLVQYVHYCVDLGGNIHTPTKGIPRGCALSPLIGAFHLYALDAYFAQKSVFYVRYMDDVVLLTRTRCQLRKAIRQLNQFFAQFGFAQHPDKIFIGRMAKGFDWMGAWFIDKGITGVAPRAIDNHRERWSEWVTCVLQGPKGKGEDKTTPDYPGTQTAGRPGTFLTSGTRSPSTWHSMRPMPG